MQTPEKGSHLDQSSSESTKKRTSRREPFATFKGKVLPDSEERVARGIWTGAISFGLINIPVQIMSAKESESISFRMLDSRDNSPIGYKQINKSTGKEVDRKYIVKGYEYEPNQYVIMDEEDFEAANPKQTKTIDIEDFVEVEDLDPLLFEKPYYLVPAKNGEKGYVLLRKVLQKTKKAAVARFVLRKKQHLVAIMARGDYLICEQLRYAQEVREVDQARFLEDVDLEKVKISDKEIAMAQSLVDGMTADWDPDKYHDTYNDDLMKRIELKANKGDLQTAPEVDDVKPTNTNIVDLMPLLEKSLEAAKRPEKKAGKKKAGSKAAGAAHRKKASPKSKQHGAHA